MRREGEDEVRERGKLGMRRRRGIRSQGPRKSENKFYGMRRRSENEPASGVINKYALERGRW